MHSRDLHEQDLLEEGIFDDDEDDTIRVKTVKIVCYDF